MGADVTHTQGPAEGLQLSLVWLGAQIIASLPFKVAVYLYTSGWQEYHAAAQEAHWLPGYVAQS